MLPEWRLDTMSFMHTMDLEYEKLVFRAHNILLRDGI